MEDEYKKKVGNDWEDKKASNKEVKKKWALRQKVSELLEKPSKKAPTECDENDGYCVSGNTNWNDDRSNVLVKNCNDDGSNVLVTNCSDDGSNVLVTNCNDDGLNVVIGDGNENPWCKSKKEEAVEPEKESITTTTIRVDTPDLKRNSAEIIPNQTVSLVEYT